MIHEGPFSPDRVKDFRPVFSNEPVEAASFLASGCELTRESRES